MDAEVRAAQEAKAGFKAINEHFEPICRAQQLCRSYAKLPTKQFRWIPAIPLESPVEETVGWRPRYS